MKIFRYISETGLRLGAEVENKRLDLTSAGPEFADISNWLAAPGPLGALRKATIRQGVPADVVMTVPIDTQEVWASGVTYLRSKVARMEESDHAGDFYDRVYEA